MKKLYFIRHAEIGLEFRGRYVGKCDPPLSASGIRSSIALGEAVREKLSRCDAWISPSLRCRQTWDHMYLPNRAAALEDLLEINFGDWEGKSFAEIHRSHPDLVEAWSNFDPGFSFPGGESLSVFVGRMEAVRKKILSSPEKEMALLTHGGVIATLLCLFLDLRPSQYLLFHLDRPSVSTMTVFNNGKGVLTGLNSSGGSVPEPILVGDAPEKSAGGEWPG